MYSKIMASSLEEYEEFSVNTMSLMSSPFKILSVIALYLWFCLKAGPYFMKNREPFQLKGFLIAYNLSQVIFNICAIYMIAKLSGDVDYKCEPVTTSSTPVGRQIIWANHALFLLRVYDLIDTIFFVLRKKTHQISTLHLYHHSIIPLWGWLSTKYFPGGNLWLFVSLNSIVHSVMYFYYLVAALGPQYQKYLWWKKYITILQMIQFLLAFGHGFQSLFRDCNYPKMATFVICLQSAIFFYMFGKFYIKSYMKKPVTRKEDIKHQIIKDGKH